MSKKIIFSNDIAQLATTLDSLRIPKHIQASIIAPTQRVCQQLAENIVSYFNKKSEYATRSPSNDLRIDLYDGSIVEIMTLDKVRGRKLDDYIFVYEANNIVKEAVC